MATPTLQGSPSYDMIGICRSGEQSREKSTLLFGLLQSMENGNFQRPEKIRQFIILAFIIELTFGPVICMSPPTPETITS